MKTEIPSDVMLIHVLTHVLTYIKYIAIYGIDFN